MAALRKPDGGCPGPRPGFPSIRHPTRSRRLWVADAIERGFDDLLREFGDLLLQPVFHAQMAAGERPVRLRRDVVQAITEKLIRRHPHVFGEQTARDASGAKARWDDVKEDERQGQGPRARKPSCR